jgi:hypothetical protein
MTVTYGADYSARELSVSELDSDHQARSCTDTRSLGQDFILL